MTTTLRQSGTGAPDRHMGNSVGAVIVSILCGSGLGLIPGIVAIVYSAKVRDDFGAGGPDAAAVTQDKARKWASASYGITILLWVLSFAYGLYTVFLG